MFYVLYKPTLSPDTNGAIGLWHTTVSSVTPYCLLNCHDRATRDFAFLGSASVLASVGSSSNNRSVPPLRSLSVETKRTFCLGHGCLHDHIPTILLNIQNVC